MSRVPSPRAKVALLDNLFEHLEEERSRIDTCLTRLPEDVLWRRPRPGVNSIGNLCLHLWGNESHYLGHGVGGTDFRRDRAAEFTADGGPSSQELRAKLLQAREATRGILAGLDEGDLGGLVDVNHPEEPTVLRVILHVVTHYSYHTGQIVHLTRVYQTADGRVLEWGH